MRLDINSNESLISIKMVVIIILLHNFIECFVEYITNAKKSAMYRNRYPLFLVECSFKNLNAF